MRIANIGLLSGILALLLAGCLSVETHVCVDDNVVSLRNFHGVYEGILGEEEASQYQVTRQRGVGRYRLEKISNEEENPFKAADIRTCKISEQIIMQYELVDGETKVYYMFRLDGKSNGYDVTALTYDEDKLVNSGLDYAPHREVIGITVPFVHIDNRNVAPEKIIEITRDTETTFFEKIK